MARPSRFGISFEGGDPPETLRAVVDVADQAGASTLWVASHLFQREPIVCGAMSLTTSPNITIALMAMSPYVVHPVYIAMAAATLDEYFPGRVQLCFGVGAPRDLEAAGIAAEHPLSTLRESIAVARALFAGDTIKFEGQRYRVSGRQLENGGRSVPISLAASGPKMLELAGEVADGVLISAAASPEFVRWSLDQVRKGEEKAGRRIDKAALVFCSLDDDSRAAKDRLRRKLAFILRGQHHARNLELAGIDLDQSALVEAYAQQDWTRAEALVTDEVVRRHSAAGTPDEVRDALSAYQEVGVDEIVVAGVRDAESLERILQAVQA